MYAKVGIWTAAGASREIVVIQGVADVAGPSRAQLLPEPRVYARRVLEAAELGAATPTSAHACSPLEVGRGAAVNTAVGARHVATVDARFNLSVPGTLARHERELSFLLHLLQQAKEKPKPLRLLSSTFQPPWLPVSVGREKY